MRASAEPGSDFTPTDSQNYTRRRDGVDDVKKAPLTITADSKARFTSRSAGVDCQLCRFVNGTPGLTTRWSRRGEPGLVGDYAITATDRWQLHITT